MRRIKIVSDGTARGTLILDAHGEYVRFGDTGVTRVVIEPIEPNGVVRAHITLEQIALEIDAGTDGGE